MNKRSKSNQRGYIDFNVLIGGIVALLVIGGIIVGNVVVWNWVHTTGTQVCKITNKESVTKDKTNQYRVYTDNCGVFQVSDEAWLGKFNSADTYSKIQPGTSYTLHTVGWRNGLFSQFPNIIQADQ